MKLLFLLPAIQSFTPALPRRNVNIHSTTTLHGLKGGKFSKQKNLAAKMEEAKRQRQAAAGEATGEEDGLTKEEVQLRNDRKRFENLLENSLLEGGDMGNNYLTLQQEEEAAEAVCEE
jgi:hypothetical protein